MQGLRNIVQADHGRHRLALGVSLALHAIVLVAAQVLVFPKSPQFGLFSGVQSPESIPEAPFKLDLTPPAVLEPVVAVFSESGLAPEPSSVAEPEPEPEPEPKPEPVTDASPPPSPTPASAPLDPVELAGVTPAPTPPTPEPVLDSPQTPPLRPEPKPSPAQPVETAPPTTFEITAPITTSNQVVGEPPVAPAPTTDAAAPAVTRMAMAPTAPAIAQPATSPSPNFTDARYAYRPAPIYPPSARRLELEGSVVLDVQINADGTVRSAAVRTGSGHRILDQAALSGIRRWRFEPARRGATPVPSSAIVPIEFRLE